MNFSLPASLAFVVTAGALALLSGCGSSSDGGSGSASGSTGGFELVSISVPNNAVWQINRRIEFEFSEPVAFNSINTSSISVATMAGKPAIGDFFVKTVPAPGGGQTALPNVIIWQPRCPTLGDFSDAGLDVGGVVYRILVQGADISTGIAVKSKGGDVLETSQVRHFSTPTSLQPTSLFFDSSPGAPSVIVRAEGSNILDASYLEIGGDPDAKTYFEIDENGQPIVITDTPINLLSDQSQSIAAVLEFDQPLAPASGNVSNSNLGLEFFDTTNGTWTALPVEVQFVANCTKAGARVRIEPVGSIPQASLFRVVKGAALADLVGQTGSQDLSNFARFETAVVTVPGLGTPGDLADELFEPFDVGGVKAGSLEDVTAVFAEPKALWGNGVLAPNFSFLGTGGPSGTFDLHITDGAALFNTNSQTFNGGPGVISGSVPSAQQTAVNGLLQVRNLRIADGASLIVVGPNPARIFATGEVEILGSIVLDGGDAPPQVGQLITPNNPEIGAPGVAGGGSGGTGSPLTTSTDLKGGTGFGPFNAPGLGGEGGETGHPENPGPQDQPLQRRAGGGGGARLAADVNLLAAEIAENGRNGSNEALGAISGQSPPAGGKAGPPVFFDADPTNDFFGVRQVDPTTLLQGELTAPTAGAGGGAGGDSTPSGILPHPDWTTGVPPEQKGSAGGGGGGQLQILAVGNITIGANGRILARGGDGGRGESTNTNNTVGGSSGGGSGGHIILQTAANIIVQTTTANSLDARGGAAGPNAPSTQIAGGGRGGGGIIQLHAQSAANIVGPDGTTPASTATLNNIASPNPWVLLPSFGRFSKTRSKFIPLGGANVNPASSTGDVTFLFDGTDEDPLSPTAGEVLRDAITPTIVADLPPLPVSDIVSVDPVARRVVIDATPLVDDDADPQTPFLGDIYLRNPSLLRQFELKLTEGFLVRSFTVAQASYDSTAVELTLDLDSTGGSLADFDAGSGLELIPRYFRVLTGSALDALPLSSSVAIRFQAVRATFDGQPDVAAPLVDWTVDIDEFNAVAEDIGFFRFEVEFNLDVQGTGISANSPRPTLTFLRVPFRF